MRYRILFFLTIALFIASCTKNDINTEKVPSKNEYLISVKELKTYTENDIRQYTSSSFFTIIDQISQFRKFKSYIKSGIKVYKITYKTKFDGKIINASGLVCLPDKSGKYPIFSYQNGTNTLHNKAPSQDYTNTVFKVLQMIGSTGFIVAIPDYLGFGEAKNMFHPYLHKKSTVQSVTDMWRAVKEMVENNNDIDFNNDLYISGYSQGGWATMALHESISTHKTNEFHIKANASLAGPYNLSKLNHHVLNSKTYPSPYFIAYLFNSYKNLNNSSIKISEIFQQPYANRIPTLFDGTKSGGEINSQLTSTISDLFTPEYVKNWNTGIKYKPAKEILAENSIKAFETKTPILIIHGEEDKVVIPEMSSDIYNDLKKITPNSVFYISLKGLGHHNAVIPANLTAVLWIIEKKEENEKIKNS